MFNVKLPKDSTMKWKIACSPDQTINLKIKEFCNFIEEDYKSHPTGCGGSFGEILCYEIHENNLTFNWLAKKWGITVEFLGYVILDHCKKLMPSNRESK